MKVPASDDAPGLRVGIVGCGLIGTKRSAVLGKDRVIGVFDTDASATARLAGETGGQACETAEALFDLKPDVVIVAVTHNHLADLACAALEAGCHVLVEKPAGMGTSDVDRVAEAAKRAGRLVKVGFNHRFHPGVMRAVTEARSGDFGDLFSLRARYGHGGRLGYEKEWRADPAQSGGGEIVDQGMHLLDISYWLLGDLPVHGSMLRTQFWQAPVDDNAVLLLGEPGGVGDRSPFALLHVTWTEWKNLFSLEITCERAKWEVQGLVRSYGPQVLRVHRMRPELGPPDTEEFHYPDVDRSFEWEWEQFGGAIRSGDGRELWGDLASARYSWKCIEATRTTAEVHAGR